jgi:hypothetical protein
MNTEQKTPEQWFQQLKEPYRSEAIKAINKTYRYYKEYPTSLNDALENSFKFKEQDRDWNDIFFSINQGETTYLETELKPQDMISGEWYVVETKSNNTFLCRFFNINERRVNTDFTYDYRNERIYNKEGLLCYTDDIKSIRKATREEVLEHFPDEFKEEKKEVESELKDGEVYFWSEGESFYRTVNLNFAIQSAEVGSTIYKATPIGTKQTKSILEPIKPNN